MEAHPTTSRQSPAGDPGLGLWALLRRASAAGGLAGVFLGSIESLAVIWGSLIVWGAPMSPGLAAVEMSAAALLGLVLGAAAGLVVWAHSLRRRALPDRASAVDTAVFPAAEPDRRDAAIGILLLVFLTFVYLMVHAHLVLLDLDPWTDRRGLVATALLVLGSVAAWILLSRTVASGRLLPPPRYPFALESGAVVTVLAGCAAIGWLVAPKRFSPVVLGGQALLALAGGALYLVVARSRGRRRARARGGRAGLAMAAGVGPALVLLSCLVLAPVRRGSPPPAGRAPGAPSPRAQERGLEEGLPPILILSLDTVRVDHVSAYGYPRGTTPNVDRLAADGVRLSNARSTSSWSFPAYSSLFTGTFPTRSGAHHRAGGEWWTDSVPLPLGFTTLAEVLGEAGYHTAAIGANPNGLGKFLQVDQGFDYYRIFLGYWPSPLNPHVLELARILAPGPMGLLMNLKADARELNRRVLTYLEAYRHTPFLLFVNFMDAHLPYVLPPPFDRKFPGFDPGFEAPPYKRLTQRVIEGGAPVTERELAHLFSLYDAEIAYVDHEVGRIVTKLEELGLYDKAMIVIMADHGEAFGENGLLWHGRALIEGLVRVPLIVKYPHGAKTGVVDRPVQLVDVMPEILSHLGLPIPEEVQGEPFAEVRHPIVTEKYLIAVDTPLVRQFDLLRCLYDGPWKLVQGIGKDGEEHYKLFDLASDPAEEEDRAADAPEVLAMLRERLRAWVEIQEALAAGASEATVLEEASERLKERFGELGYPD